MISVLWKPRVTSFTLVCCLFGGTFGLHFAPFSTEKKNHGVCKGVELKTYFEKSFIRRLFIEIRVEVFDHNQAARAAWDHQSLSTGCFGQHLSMITVFTLAQTNHPWPRGQMHQGSSQTHSKNMKETSNKQDSALHTSSTLGTNSHFLK